MAKLQTPRKRAERMSVLERDLLYVTGKGGVGKTTVALALALVAARQGMRVILCEVGGQARAQALFGYDGARPGHEAALEDGLWATSIDPALALEEWAARQIGSRRLVHVLTGSSVFSGFVNAAPGARELLAITKAWELGRPDRWVCSASGYDLVVLDAPASGHGLGLLRTPRTFAEIARVGRVARQGRTIDAMLSDPARTGVVAVARPEEMPVTEALALQDAVRGAVGLEVGLVVANAVLPQRFSAADARALAAAATDGGAPLRAARTAHARAQSQRSQLRRLRRHARAPVATLPFLPVAALGREEHERLAAGLEDVL
jgi:anion-transporting  ArsA/GET3 family ATPase